MKQIWKYPISTTDVQTVSMPAGSKVLCVQTQQGGPFIWALVDPKMPRRDFQVRVFGTGHPCECNAEEYVGTYQLAAGSLVFHVFVQAEKGAA